MRSLLLLFPLFCVGCAVNTTYLTAVNVTPGDKPNTYYVQAAVREHRSSWCYERLHTYATEPVLVSPGKEAVNASQKFEDKEVSMKAYVPTKDENQAAAIMVEFRKDKEMLNATRLLVPLQGK